MRNLNQEITLEDSCKLIKQSKYIFAPLKEAITNSLDAITQRQSKEKEFTPHIVVSAHFTRSNELFDKEVKEIVALNFIAVEDNGIGFTASNLERFTKLGTNTKKLNNRGTGKIQIFHRFEQISINSVFYESGKWNQLKVNWEKTGEYETTIEETKNLVDNKTIVKMSRFSGNEKENEFFSKYLDNIDEFKRDVLKRFLLRLWLGTTKNNLTLKIQTFMDGSMRDEFTFDRSNIPEPTEEKFSIRTEQAQFTTVRKKDKDEVKIDWISIEPKNELIARRFKLAATDMDENGVYMCNKDIVVEAFGFPVVRKHANFKGFRYLTSVSGELLDNPENVNQAVDGFMFLSKKKVEADLIDGYINLFNSENKFVFWDEIKENIRHTLFILYSDVGDLQKEYEKNIAELAKRYGISLEDAEEANIYIDDTEERATEKLFKTQAMRFAKRNMEIQQTYNELKELKINQLDPTEKEYRAKFAELSNKLLEKIPQQNKDELARYIIRRDMVVSLLDLALGEKLTKQIDWAEKKAAGIDVRRDMEGIIHDLIFKRRTKGLPNDLWILNEEFVHFDGYSDMKLEDLEINGEKLLQNNIDIENELAKIGIEKNTYSQQRPDVFIYPEEGKCILVEFKAPGVNLSQHTTQLAGYARLIANYSRKPRHFTQFFGFLIGEKMDLIALSGEWITIPFGKGMIYPSSPIRAIDGSNIPIANIYQEIILFSEIAERAKIRNKSFADKLGITQDDIKKISEKENLALS